MVGFREMSLVFGILGGTQWNPYNESRDLVRGEKRTGFLVRKPQIRYVHPVIDV